MITITLTGGPRHGETHWYTTPLPDILCFQRREPHGHGWVTDNYQRDTDTSYTYTYLATL